MHKSTVKVVGPGPGPAGLGTCSFPLCCVCVCVWCGVDVFMGLLFMCCVVLLFVASAESCLWITCEVIQ